MVLHTCDNPKCVRPDHLFLGNALHNTHDMIKKDRMLHGELAPWAKLTAEQVRSIRKDSRKQDDIAAEYGVIQQTISLIKRGKNWKRTP